MNEFPSVEANANVCAAPFLGNIREVQDVADAPSPNLSAAKYAMLGYLERDYGQLHVKSAQRYLRPHAIEANEFYCTGIFNGDEEL